MAASITVSLQLFKLFNFLIFSVDFDQSYIKMFSMKSSILLDIFTFCIAKIETHFDDSIANMKLFNVSKVYVKYNLPISRF